MKIVILSRKGSLYSTGRLEEAALERGHEVEVVDHLRCYVIMEKGKPRVHYHGRVFDNVDAVIPRIGASVTFYGSAIVRQFEMMGVFSTNSAHGIVRSRDKLRAIQFLSAEGIGMPKTAFAREQVDVNDLISAVGGVPVVIKLLEGTQGIGVVLAESKKAAKSVIEAFHSIGVNILIQEFIHEAKGADIRAFVVGDKVVGAMRRQGPEGEFRSNLHRGGSAKVIELTEEESQTAIHAARILDLSVAGVDLLQSNRGPLVMEVNSSPGLEGIEAATGVDIAGEIIQYIEKNAHIPRKKHKY